MKAYGKKEERKRRRRERDISHSHTCASCRHSVATFCVSSLRTKSSATSNAITTSWGVKHGQKIGISGPHPALWTLVEDIKS